MPRSLASSLLLASVLATAALGHSHADAHAHIHARALPGSWYHDRRHEAHRLFRKAGDGVSYPAVGTPEWAAGFPKDKTIDPSTIPQAWIDALNAAKAAGKIPNISPSTQTVPFTSPTYPGLDPNSKEICSATYKCKNPDDLWDAPDGVFASSFDDGPLPTSMALYEFLKSQNVVSTHFMIGVNILQNPTEFQYAFETLQSDIACHTWSHPYMTTLTNEQIVGELGFSLEIIHNSTQGRLPRYWRPPTGDSDERVRAIAKEVFGLTTVIWNQDTEDWNITATGVITRTTVDADLTKWITTAPKSPGLMILEHELSTDSVSAFIEHFPLIAQNGWKFESVARVQDGQAYQNAKDSNPDTPVTPVPVAVAVQSSPASGTSGASKVSSGASSKTSSVKSTQTSSGNSNTSAAITMASARAATVVAGSPAYNLSRFDT
ncbi:carbohydrate esterase family 4 protein [Epithele typhae]|uniref:carbohydrate esterase family 4 protein n=1 Tax=Epithele typhae TaxID=378194 RepID=UPI00200752D9|nr:carbohydrate esterase family 4 protein [Epithele typhae]KAH9922844.1 carbohydrate esterase family 4 protein [Epithele typhae]